jgi:hypothetical protein
VASIFRSAAHIKKDTAPDLSPADGPLFTRYDTAAQQLDAPYGRGEMEWRFKLKGANRGNQNIKRTNEWPDDTARDPARSASLLPRTNQPWTIHPAIHKAKAFRFVGGQRVDDDECHGNSRQTANISRHLRPPYLTGVHRNPLFQASPLPMVPGAKPHPALI